MYSRHYMAVSAFVYGRRTPYGLDLETDGYTTGGPGRDNSPRLIQGAARMICAILPSSGVSSPSFTPRRKIDTGAA